MVGGPPRTSPDDAALVPLALLHVEVAAVGDSKRCARQLAHMALVVQLYLLHGVGAAPGAGSPPPGWSLCMSGKGGGQWP